MSAPDANGWYLAEEYAPPKDGTEILAALQVHSLTTGKYWWERHIISFDEDRWEIDLDHNCGWDWDDYTHWQHLPSPPVDGGS